VVIGHHSFGSLDTFLGNVSETKQKLVVFKKAKSKSFIKVVHSEQKQ